METVMNSAVKPKSLQCSREYLQNLVHLHFQNHAFDEIQGAKESLRSTLSEYLAMSVAFPYLQAGSFGPAILRSIQNNESLKPEFEWTAVVGSFLVWDEFGGWYHTLRSGMQGLPRILETRNFHANMLRADLKQIYGDEVQSNFGMHTRDYLLSLYHRLADSNDVIRCATMVSFEMHAERMITALWGAIERICGIEKNCLRYFASHVGGNDPAEEYHIKMTTSLIELLIHQESVERFEKVFLETYQLHLNWCRSIVTHRSVN